MPSSYTARLRLEEQNPGENLNTWGSLLNANTTVLIDFSIAGRTALTPSGPITLTSNNGAADQARSAILDCTSGTGGTITIPAVSKVYQVRNNCSGNVILTTGSGTTATVEPANVATVITDGTNCYRFADAADIATSLATAKAYTDAAAFSSSSGVLPGQGGNAGNFLQTNGTTPSWVAITSGNVTTALGFTPQVALGFTPLNVANNLSDLASVVTARTNLGVTATGADTAYSFRANNLSDLANAGTARTNLGLGTSATVNTGASGATIPLLSAANTWTLAQTLTATAILSNGATITATPNTSVKEVGYGGVPQTTKGTSYGPVLADARTEIFFTTTATATLPANSSVAFVIGDFLVITADVGATVTLAITTDTLRQPNGNLTGSRTITGPGFAVVAKKKATEWWVVGGVNVT